MALAAVLLIGALASDSSARARRRRKTAAKAAAGPVSRRPAKAQRPPDEPGVPRDNQKPVVPLSAEPEATTIQTLTGRGAPDITQRSDIPSWARGWVPLPEEAPPPGPTEDERAAAGGARARSAFLMLALLLAGLAYAWAPDLMRAAGDGQPPSGPG